jgi:transposase InsO family protein
VAHLSGEPHQPFVSVDFFTVPTIRFQVLYVFLVLAHERRCILHFNVTAHPTAEWTAQQLRNAFPWDSAPRYLLRDRDRIFGDNVSRQVQDMGIEQVLSAPRSPWQRAYVERIIGTIRRECLDHVIIFNEAALYRQVKSPNSDESCLFGKSAVSITATRGVRPETLEPNDCPLRNCPAPLHSVPSYLRTTSWQLMPALGPYISSLQAKRCFIFSRMKTLLPARGFREAQ